MVDGISVGVQERDYVSDVVFPNERFGSTFIEDLRLTMKMFAKATAFFGDHGGSVRLQVILFVELECFDTGMSFM